MHSILQRHTLQQFITTPLNFWFVAVIFHYSLIHWEILCSVQCFVETLCLRPHFTDKEKQTKTEKPNPCLWCRYVCHGVLFEKKCNFLTCFQIICISKFPNSHFSQLNVVMVLYLRFSVHSVTCCVVCSHYCLYIWAVQMAKSEIMT